MSIDVTIWSDIACPWCYIGKRRFERALAEFPRRDEVRVTWRSYQLDPTVPDHDHRSETEYLSQAKGIPVPTVQQMVSHVVEQARGEGLDYDYDSIVVANSRRAHRVLQGAKVADAADGGHRADALKESLLRSHFVEGRDIGDGEVLVRLAEEAGVDAAEALAALDSSEMEEAVARDVAEAGAVGVRGVPFFVLGGKYGVSGAQPPEVFRQALDLVAAETAPALISVDGGAGEACGPDGCL